MLQAGLTDDVSGLEPSQCLGIKVSSRPHRHGNWHIEQKGNQSLSCVLGLRSRARDGDAAKQGGKEACAVATVPSAPRNVEKHRTVDGRGRKLCSAEAVRATTHH